MLRGEEHHTGATGFMSGERLMHHCCYGTTNEIMPSRGKVTSCEWRPNLTLVSSVHMQLSVFVFSGRTPCHETVRYKTLPPGRESRIDTIPVVNFVRSCVGG